MGEQPEARIPRQRATVHAELEAAVTARNDASRRLDFDAYTGWVARIHDLLDELHALRVREARADATY